MYIVISSPLFDREIKKFQKQNSLVVSVYEKSLEVIKVDPFNISRVYQIKKLTDVPFGKGQWRIKIGQYRIRYDIDDQTVILRRIRDRKDVYRK